MQNFFTQICQKLINFLKEFWQTSDMPIRCGEMSKRNTFIFCNVNMNEAMIFSNNEKERPYWNMNIQILMKGLNFSN